MKVVFAPGFEASLAKCFRSRWHPAELWYRFKCWAWRRHTTVKPRWLDHTWCDRVALLPHIMFEILGQFIEKECAPPVVEWYGAHGHKIDIDGTSKYVRDEMQELWDWWCQVYVGQPDKYPDSYAGRRKAIHAQIDKIDDESLISDTDADDASQCLTYNPQYKTPGAAEQTRALYKQLFAIDAEEDAELQARLHRLVNIREYLWT